MPQDPLKPVPAHQSTLQGPTNDPNAPLSDEEIAELVEDGAFEAFFSKMTPDERQRALKYAVANKPEYIEVYPLVPPQLMGAKALNLPKVSLPKVSPQVVTQAMPWLGGIIGGAMKHPIAGYMAGTRAAKWLGSKMAPKAASPVTRVTGPMSDRASMVDEIAERVTEGGFPNRAGVPGWFKGRVGSVGGPKANPMPNGAPKRPQARPGGTQQAASNDSAKVPPRRPSGPAPKLPAGNNADYQGWVDKVNSRAPLTTDIEKLLAELRKSLTKDAKRVPGKRPTQRKPK